MTEQTLDPSVSNQTEDTIVARSTPPGRSLKAVVRLSGPETTYLVREVVDDAARQWMNEHRFDTRDVTIRIAHPRVTSFPGTLFLMQKPRSYTGEDTAEFHIPGSTPLIELLIEQLQELGARTAEPGEFTERAFLNDRLDLAQAEAVLSLIEARDEEERQMALGQLEGKLSEKVDDLRERLTHLCAYVESALDFADQDIDVIDRDGIRSYLDPILSRVNDIIKTGRARKPVREDAIGAFYGRPNVGKSSLFNTLIQEDRSIVTEIAGTTRDVIEGTLLVDEHPIRLLDTAGVEDLEGDQASRDELEQKMTERAHRAVSRAHLVLHVEEARTVLNNGSFPELSVDGREHDRLNIVSKMDELDENEQHQLTSEVLAPSRNEEYVFTSAEDHSGINQLTRSIQEQLRASGMNGGAFRLNVRHLESLKKAKNHLERGLQAVNDGRPYELIAVDLRDALDALGEIVGEVGIEDILGVIFSEFCIGK